MAKLEQVLRGIKSVQCRNPKRITRLPISPDLLDKMRRVWIKEPCTFNGRMLWAASSLCFFGFLRSGEITIPSDSAYDEGAHLGFKDIAVDCLHCPQVVKVHLKAV